jgi:anti-sigma B factor antagonist
MSFRVTTSNVEPDIVVLHLSGSITISPEAEALESLLLDLLGEKIRRLVFDLAGIDAIEPAATVFLIRCFFRTRSAGGQLRFAGANEQVLRPFRTAMLDTLLPFDPTVACVCRLRLVGSGGDLQGRPAGARHRRPKDGPAPSPGGRERGRHRERPRGRGRSGLGETSAPPSRSPWQGRVLSTAHRRRSAEHRQCTRHAFRWFANWKRKSRPARGAGRRPGVCPTVK